jgi:hypothetical protein
MSIETIAPVASNLPFVEKERVDIRLCLTIRRNPQTGETKAYVNQLDLTNYDGLIDNVPDFLNEFELRYGINQIISAAKNHLSNVAQ